ncbi:MAG: hypothetical protein IJ226_04575 [Clostridia bacterium]|nr:hypothetical protein [Clostridia bacterium]
MFGYVIPDKDNMLIKDFNVFQAFYCGLCKALHETGSEVTRFCTNYDVTFYSVLMHEITKTPVKFERKLCVYNGRKKVIVEPDELSKKMADLAVLLVYYNIKDDVADGKKLRAPLAWRLALRKRKAAKRMPKIDALMREQFGLLARLEKEKCDSIDRVADTFASLMRDITRELIREDEESKLTKYTESNEQLVEPTKAKQTVEDCEDCEDCEGSKRSQISEDDKERAKSLTEDEKRDIDDFCYNLGRLVYLADAVDDVEKDSKKGTYNVLLLNYGECAKKADYLVKNADELSFLLKSTYNKMVGAYNRMNVSMYEGVLSNTVYLGIDMQIGRLLKGDEKCQITRL